MTSLAFKPRVRFNLELDFQNRVEKDRHLAIFGGRFFALVREAKSRKYFATDYSTLNGIRKLLEQHSRLEELVPSLEGKLDDSNMVRLTEVAPMFDASPIDLQAYILMSLGMRVYNNAVTQ